jgi:hypothetical protein
MSTKKPTQITKSFYVPKRSHFNLIGRGGSNVKGLQEDFNVKINIPRKEDNTSQITVTGQESDILACKDELEQQLGYEIGEQEFGQMVLDVPKNKHGIILGSGGSNIRTLEQKTGCNIIIPGREEKTSNVTLEGTPEKLEHLRELIEDLVGELKVVSSTSTVSHLKTTNDLKDFTSGEINDALFFPDTDKSDGLNYEIFLKYLSSPKKTLDVCVFTITDDSAANILIDLHKKGIKVRIITDDDQSASTGSDIQTMKKAGIPLKMDSTPYHMHNKFAIIDGILLLNGSYNWTTTANTKNNENMIVTNNKKLVSAFSTQFEVLWKQFK